MPDFDADRLTPADQYKLMAGSIVPRPIALVTTIGRHGTNAAPYSLFNMLGVDPPMLMFSVTPRGEQIKDTLRNIEEDVPEFVVHIVDEAVSAKMSLAAADFPRGVSEIDFAGFQTAPSIKVRPPRLVECPVQLECRLMQILRVGRRPNVLVIGEVVHFHFREGLVNAQHHVDTDALGAIGRMMGGHGAYTRTRDRFGLPLPEIPGVKASTA